MCCRHGHVHVRVHGAPRWTADAMRTGDEDVVALLLDAGNATGATGRPAVSGSSVGDIRDMHMYMYMYMYMYMHMHMYMYMYMCLYMYICMYMYMYDGAASVDKTWFKGDPPPPLPPSLCGPKQGGKGGGGAQSPEQRAGARRWPEPRVFVGVRV